MRRSRVLSGRSVHARSVRRTREELAVFGGAIGAADPLSLLGGAVVGAEEGAAVVSGVGGVGFGVGAGVGTGVGAGEGAVANRGRVRAEVDH